MMNQRNRRDKLERIFTIMHSRYRANFHTLQISHASVRNWQSFQQQQKLCKTYEQEFHDKGKLNGQQTLKMIL